jgi:cell division cycle 2-like protein
MSTKIDLSKSEKLKRKSRPKPSNEEDISAKAAKMVAHAKQLVMDLTDSEDEETKNLPPYLPAVYGCRSVEEFEISNKVEEGTYGVVYRAREKHGKKEMVALKKLKMDREREGFPITSLREVNTLLRSQHENIVTVREIVVGYNADQIFIVMDFIEHDMKALMETMKSNKQSFTVGEVKCLMRQLIEGIAHMHDNWILHRDLKASNLLLSHGGILKIADFGLARDYGSPLKPYTPVVVTLWYRSPELLLGVKKYSTAVDMWSVGCLFGEFLQMKPLFQGKSEYQQLTLIFGLMGVPTEKRWPGYKQLPLATKMKFDGPDVSQLRKKFAKTITSQGHHMLDGLLNYSTDRRMTCDQCLKHPWFTESPLPIDPSMFPMWPAKSEKTSSGQKTPPAPAPGANAKEADLDDKTGFSIAAAPQQRGGGFTLKF